MVIACSLVIDPFVRQLRHVPLERVVVDSAPSIPVSSLFSGGTPPDDTEKAVKLAFVGSKVPETTANCPSGNCSWSPYQSLAVCHQCLDISDQIQFKDSCFYDNTTACAASLMNGLTIEVGRVSTPSNATVMETTGKGPLLKIDNVGQSLINFTKLYLDPPGAGLHTDCYDREKSIIPQCLQAIRRTVAATECTLHWCINRYSATQESGVFKEMFLDSWWSRSSHDVVTLREPRTVGVPLAQYFQLLPSDDECSIDVSGQNSSQEVSDDSHGRVPDQRPTNCGPCYVGTKQNNDLVLWLANFFTRELAFFNAVGQNNDTDDAAVVLAGQNKPPFGKRIDNPRADPIFDIFSSVALGLTQFIRLDPQSLPGSHSYPVSTTDGRSYLLNFTVLGTAFEDRTVVDVRWEWLSLPAGLVFMTVALTIATKIRGSKRHIPVWGSSTTALMFRGPYSHTDDETSSDLLSASQMHEKAKSTKVSLGRSVDGSWRLYTRDDPGIRSKSTDLESAMSMLPHCTTHEVTTYPPTKCYAEQWEASAKYQAHEVPNFLKSPPPQIEKFLIAHGQTNNQRMDSRPNRRGVAF
ncbi:MAG: hypothetical protein Q9210_003635 [Variospora velana]